MSWEGVLLLHPASAISSGTSSESMAIRCFIEVVTQKGRFYYNIYEIFLFAEGVGVVFELYGVEKCVESDARVVGSLGTEHFGGLLFGDGEAASEEAPVFLDFAHAAFVADGQEVDGFNEGEDEAEGGLEVVGLPVLDAEGEEGVVENAATNHAVFNLGEPLLYAAIVGGGADVAVVDDFVV